MTRRVIAAVVAVMVGIAAEGTLIQAGAQTLHSAPVPLSVDTPAIAGDLADLEEVACLRGADACFGYGSDNCCTEMYILGAIAGAIGAWLAAGVAAWYGIEYC